MVNALRKKYLGHIPDELNRWVGYPVDPDVGRLRGVPMGVIVKPRDWLAGPKR